MARDVEKKRRAWRDWYHRNKHAETVRKGEDRRNNRDEIKQWLAELKAQLKCIRCGFNHPAALAFHHRNPAEKDFAIADSMTSTTSKERIIMEIAKCDVLCSNCHLIVHWCERVESRGVAVK